MKELLIYATWMAAPAPAVAPPTVRAPSVYCTQSAAGQWSVQRFKPLIRVGGGTVFAELTFAGNSLFEFKLRRFEADYETAFSYKFDSSGKLVGLMGSILVHPPVIKVDENAEPPISIDWVAEADLMPGADWKIPAHHTVYSRDKDRIEKPDDAEKFIGKFNTAPVYRTVETVPCAALMKDAKELNAEQQ